MKKEDIKFEIDQLRKDKIVYATEAVAVSAACFLGFFMIIILGNSFPRIIPLLTQEISYILCAIIALIGVGDVIFMGIGNFYRSKRIGEFEKLLSMHNNS